LLVLGSLGSFGLLDAIDIGVVALGIYVAVGWLRRSQAALVGIGVVLIGVLYAAARGIGLALTSWALEGFFAVLAIALVVLFQDELRQAFEELAAWALGRKRDHRPRLDAVEILSASLFRLSEQRVGALVVLPGLQKLDRHMHGGVELNGQLSAALLESLFDHHSAGHDGAVIVEDRSVLRFGVQLPLSKAVPHLASRGTRHSAARGLSERTDALCVVGLESIPSADQLELRLKRFYRERRSLATPEPSPTRWLRERHGEKAAALAAAFALWLLVSVSGQDPTPGHPPENGVVVATPLP
jgi:DNA integrity scanning protein DisA with diadenylate cyclase activity